MADLTDTEPIAEASERRVLAGLVVLAAIYVAGFGWRLRDAVVDDAFIGLVYLRNLLEGHGFELAAPQQDDHTNATIADSPVRLSTKAEPILCIDGETYAPW